MTTLYDVFDAAVDNFKINDVHGDMTTEYFEEYAYNAMGVTLTTSQAKLCEEKAKLVTLDDLIYYFNCSLNEYYHEIELPLSEIKVGYQKTKSKGRLSK